MGYTDQTLKKLFALSGNVCAFPGCTAPIVDTDMDVVVGDICHIKGKSENGPRYDPTQSEAERNGYDNLLVMCVPHNRIVDGKKTRHLYPVEVLQEYKRDHEAQYQRSVIDNAALDAFVDAFMVAGSVITTHNQSGGQNANTINNIYASPSTSATHVTSSNSKKYPDNPNLRQALIRLQVLNDHLPTEDLSQTYINDYHALLDAVQTEINQDLAPFHIPQRELVRHISNISWEGAYKGNQISYGKELYCPSTVFRIALSGALHFIDSCLHQQPRQPQTSETPQPADSYKPDEIGVEILKQIGQQNSYESELANVLKLKPKQIRNSLGLLEKHHYVGLQRPENRASYYSLTQTGRDYLNRLLHSDQQSAITPPNEKLDKTLALLRSFRNNLPKRALDLSDKDEYHSLLATAAKELKCDLDDFRIPDSAIKSRKIAQSFSMDMFGTTYGEPYRIEHYIPPDAFKRQLDALINFLDRKRD
jgi:DNA-binding PadR family transcriptional regulator